MKKPELGLTPYHIWVGQIEQLHIHERLEDIKQAITRYAQNNQTISEFWIREYNEIIEKLKKENE